jgi:hypothetical protein
MNQSLGTFHVWNIYIKPWTGGDKPKNDYGNILLSCVAQAFLTTYILSVYSDLYKMLWHISSTMFLDQPQCSLLEGKFGWYEKGARECNWDREGEICTSNIQSLFTRVMWSKNTDHSNYTWKTLLVAHFNQWQLIYLTWPNENEGFTNLKVLLYGKFGFWFGIIMKLEFLLYY